ncbi:MAG: hypothetical protein EBV71_00085, partial [Chitinophagia bacterium]|nr:hypothetical protein [Chitinophagia bacterium]
RNTLYSHNADLTYNVPTSSFPLLDWTSLNLAYRTTYNWVGASRLAISLGNTLQNSNQAGATAELNFVQLYSKVRFLRAIDGSGAAPAPKQPKTASNKKKKEKKDKDGNVIEEKEKKEKEKEKEIKQKKDIELSGAEKTILRIITALKRVGASYNEGGTTFLPGYTDSTRALGQNWRSLSPGVDFIAGKSNGYC